MTTLLIISFLLSITLTYAIAYCSSKMEEDWYYMPTIVILTIVDIIAFVSWIFLLGLWIDKSVTI